MICFRSNFLALLLICGSVSAHAALFEDDEARKAILDLRQRIEAVRQDSAQSAARAAEDVLLLRRSLLELQTQIELLRTEVAELRGQGEQLSRSLSTSRQEQKDLMQSVDERLRPLEPVKIVLDGREFLAEPAEKRDFDAAMVIFKKGDFSSSQVAFSSFLRRYPSTAFKSSSLFWLGNAQYAVRDYKESIASFRSLISNAPDHSRVPEAVLSIANCQIELKDTRGARKTLEDLIKAYPDSEASVVARERLIRLK